MKKAILTFKHYCLFMLTIATFIVPSLSSAAPEDWETSLLVRERVQFFENFNFNDKVDTDRWELNSLASLTAKRKFSENFKLVLNAKFINIRNDDWGGPVHHFSQSDLYKAYLEYKTDSLTFKLGRQQLVYGDQRLLGHLGWKDVSRSFDGAKVAYKKGKLKADLFVVRPADIVSMSNAPETTTSGQSLVTWEDRRLIGLYTTYKVNEDLGLDLYFINWAHSASEEGPAAGRDVDTYGARAFYKKGQIDATAEYVMQSGDWTKTVEKDSSALAIKAGYTLTGDSKTRLGIEYDHSPGDDGKDATKNKVFIFPFHTNHMHYGEMDYFSWANMQDIRFSIKSSPTKSLTLMANYHMLELDEATDGWYDVVGLDVQPGFGAGAPTYKKTDAGTELDLKVVYKVQSVKGLKLVLNHSHFTPGDVVKERTGKEGDDAQFTYLFAAYKF